MNRAGRITEHGSLLSDHDRCVIVDAIDELGRIAMREGRNAVRPAVQGALIDIATQLRVVLIWARPGSGADKGVRA